MTRIYTKTGDAGLTGLFGGGRVRKDDVRVDAYGEVDELNAAMGVARSHGVDPELDALCEQIQHQLFTVGSELATPRESRAADHIPKVRPEWISEFEARMDRFSSELPALTHFILPGGSPAASALHLARTICRRAERKVVGLLEAKAVDPEVVIFLNRLSDLLFVMARVANLRAQVQDVIWTAPKHGK